MKDHWFPPTLALPVLIHFYPRPNTRYCSSLEKRLLGYHLVYCWEGRCNVMQSHLHRKARWEDCNTDRTFVTHRTSGKAGCVPEHLVLQPRHNLTQLPDSTHTKTCFDARTWRAGRRGVHIHSGYSQDFLTFRSSILNLNYFSLF